jgi:hypothetical protein
VQRGPVLAEHRDILSQSVGASAHEPTCVVMRSNS